MSKWTPTELAKSLGEGLLSFPVTHFDKKLSFDERAYRDHVSWLLQWKPAGLFAPGGTGELFSLSTEEILRVAKAAVDEVCGKVPVVVGAGSSVSVAREIAAGAEKAGADGILLLSPYLVSASKRGLAEYMRAVCDSTKLGVIVYNRDSSIIDENTLEELCEQCPNLVGYKDGVGDIELMVRIQSRMGDRLVYIGGLPTAETFALPYLEMGVTTYSSAIFNFMPAFAQDFYAAVRRRDRAYIHEQLIKFVIPYIAIRDKGQGYAVSIIKAGLKVIGRPAGNVRPPLLDLTESEVAELRRLVEPYLASNQTTAKVLETA